MSMKNCKETSVSRLNYPAVHNQSYISYSADIHFTAPWLRVRWIDGKSAINLTPPGRLIQSNMAACNQWLSRSFNDVKLHAQHDFHLSVSSHFLFQFFALVASFEVAVHARQILRLQNIPTSAGIIWRRKIACMLPFASCSLYAHWRAPLFPFILLHLTRPSRIHSVFPWTIEAEFNQRKIEV
jgi:hypothetical protein